MRRSFLAFSLILLIPPAPAFSKEVYIPIAGSSSTVGNFRSDVRILNPSTTKDITIQAYLLPVGNRDNSGVSPSVVTVPKRQMIVLNDVVAMLGGQGLNAIRLTSADDFIATERVYALQGSTPACTITGTLGQDVPSLGTSAAKKAGVLLQLKTTTGNCSQGGVSSYRTNIGLVNPNTTAATVTLRLYDKANTLITGAPITIAPMGVLAPTNMVSGLFFSPGPSDLTDAWVSYTSTQPLFAYASLIDNCSGDPTFVAMSEDVSSATAKDIYFPTASATSAVKTDIRLFNASSTKDITVQAFVLPGGNRDNSGVTSQNITLPKRTMVVLNDALTTLGGADSSAIRLSSTDDFVATERVYGQRAPNTSCNIAGTLGQDVPAMPSSGAKKQGVLLQLKSMSGNCASGAASFQTNIGAVNPNTTAAKVTFRLYDKNNSVVATGPEITIPPRGVVAPTSMTGGFFFNSGAADLSDSWVSYSSDQPIISYASVIDLCTSDPSFVSMDEDNTTGTPVTNAKAFAVTVRSFAIEWSPSVTETNAIVVGDKVTVTITARDTTHGFELQSPDGQRLVSFSAINPGQTVSATFEVSKEGTYNFFCIKPDCGVSHSSMFGQFVAGKPSDPERPGY